MSDHEDGSTRRAKKRQEKASLILPGAPKVIAAFDKFRGTATAAQLCQSVGDAAWERGWSAHLLPLADGGEGTLDVLASLGGTLRTNTVSGPLGDPIDAQWLLRNTTAFIEMARASGLVIAGGATGNDPLNASTSGTGELISVAAQAGAKRIVVLVGGSATTDGGFGALRAMEPLPRFKGIDLVVACDVETLFVDAARVFGPQKGATDAHIRLLTRRLEMLADSYLEERGVDVRNMFGSGAAGGLAGGLASIGARITSGFDLIAEEVGLAEAMQDATLVITGEGYCDEESFDGKVVGGVCAMAAEAGVPVIALCGDVEEDLVVPPDLIGAGVTLVSLAKEFGKEQAWSDPAGCVRTFTELHMRA
jgi:glycerate 2-kinase